MPESPDDTPSQTGFDIYERPATAEEDEWARSRIERFRKSAPIACLSFAAIFLSISLGGLLIALLRGGGGPGVLNYSMASIFCILIIILVAWLTSNKQMERIIPSHNFMMIVRLKVEEALWVELNGMIIRCAGARGLAMVSRYGDLRSAETGLAKRFPGNEIQLEYYFLRRPFRGKLSTSRRDRVRVEITRSAETVY